MSRWQRRNFFSIQFKFVDVRALHLFSRQITLIVCRGRLKHDIVNVLNFHWKATLLIWCLEIQLRSFLNFQVDFTHRPGQINVCLRTRLHLLVDKALNWWFYCGNMQTLFERPCSYPLEFLAKFLRVQSSLPWSGSALWLGYVTSPVFQQTFMC